MSYPPPYYGPPSPPPKKNNAWIVWLVMGIIGVVCFCPVAVLVAFRPDAAANIVRAVFSLFGG